MARTRAHQSLNRLVQLDDIKTTERKRHKTRFRLRTMLLAISGLCVLFAMIAVVGPAFMPRLEAKMETTSSILPESMMTESFVPLSILIALGIGLVVAYTVYRLGNLKGFFVFGTLAGMGLIAVVAAMTLDIQPISETRLKHMTSMQSAFTLLLANGIVLPIASFCGWYASVVLYKTRT